MIKGFVMSSALSLSLFLSAGALAESDANEDDPYNGSVPDPVYEGDYKEPEHEEPQYEEPEYPEPEYPEPEYDEEQTPDEDDDDGAAPQ